MHTALSHEPLPFPVPRAISNQVKPSIFSSAAAYGLEDIHFKVEPKSGLKAIIAIHSTQNGPAIGGTRCLPYPNEHHAWEDAMRLAKGMSYKIAFAGLPYGGGKGVLLCPAKIPDRKAYFESYGEFVESLKGRFITAVDVGTKVSDMDIIGHKTQYVLSTSANTGDPSLHTAQGVLSAIRAAVNVKLKRPNLEGVVVAIQGVGKVGAYLARLLHEHGAKLVISDINKAAMQFCIDEFRAISIAPDQITSYACDVLSPCALGSSINEQTVHQIQAKIICGAANNQLSEDTQGDVLYRKNIFYVPDYIVNVGGLFHVIYGTSTETDRRIAAIYESVLQIWQQAQTEQLPGHRLANKIVEQILSGTRKIPAT